MKIEIKRFTTYPEIEEKTQEYDVTLKNPTLLEALLHVKATQDKTLTFSSGCRSSVCGSCAVQVNGKEVLACSHKVKENDLIEPLKNVEVIRDLVVNMDNAYKFNQKAKTWLNGTNKEVKLTQEDQKINEVQSDCILCGCCYSACPVYSVNKEFLGPFSLTRVYKYISDKRESKPNEKIDNIQTNGVWDCTLCNECTMVCPQGISSKLDIEKLRSKSAMAGYMDPNFSNNFGSFDGSPIF